MYWIVMYLFCTHLTFDLILRLRSISRLGIHPYGCWHTSRNTIIIDAKFYSMLPSKVKISLFCLNGLPTIRRVQAFEKFNYSVLRNNNIIHERCRPIQKRDLGVFIFIEHIRKLTIEFICLFEVRLSNTLSILPFQGWNTMGVFFLTIDVPIEVSGVCLNITNQVIHIQIMLFSYISLDFSS